MISTGARLLAAAAALVAAVGGCVPPEQEGAAAPAVEAVPAAPPAPFNRQLARAHFKLGRESEAAGDISTAVTYYATAISADSWAIGRGESAEEDTPFGPLARICGLGRPAEAVARACSAAIAGFRFAPEQLIEFLGNRGVARMEVGDGEGAMADFEAALKLDSSAPRVLAARARARAGGGDMTGAMADLDRAQLRAPRDPALQLTRAELLHRAGRADEAIAAYDVILGNAAYSESFPPAYRGRAAAHCRAGLADAAAIDWQVWAAAAPGGTAWLQELLWWRGFLRAPLGESLGAAAIAGLRGWTSAGCPGGNSVKPDASAI